MADNATDPGRAQNRRVVVVVHAPAPAGSVAAALNSGAVR
jgi:hypothetical protein